MVGAGERDTRQESGGSADPESVEVEDDWVRRGEYIIRRHFDPRTTLFSPYLWRKEQLEKKAQYTEPRLVDPNATVEEEKCVSIPIERLEVM